MKIIIKPKEASSIINSLIGGVVPSIGIQHITVGRDLEVDAVVKALEEVKTGNSVVKFWIGDYGSGKSFMLHLLRTVALKQNFVTSSVDFTPEKRLYDNDRKAVSLYSSLIEGLSIQTKPDGNALPTIIEKWIEQVIVLTAQENSIPMTEIRDEQYSSLVQKNIFKIINNISDVGGFEFGLVVAKYYEGYVSQNIQLTRCALRWLRGEYTTRTDAKRDLEVREIIDDHNYYNMLKNLCKFFVQIGYGGFVINLDEAINLYKIIKPTREKNYETILSIYNDCLQGKCSNLFINFGGTIDFLENERRGLFSYHALKSRLEGNKYETKEIRDYSQPVIKLTPLTNNEIFVLLNKLKEIFDINYSTTIDFSNHDVLQFMEHVFNKPGAYEFLTPREVIRNFLNILNILRQNPKQDKSKILELIEVVNPKKSDLENIEVEEI